MKCIRFISIVILILSVSNSFAQKANAQKILGCWILKKMEYSQPEKNSEELINDALNTVICFEKNGKFTNKNDKNPILINGTYSFSEDGKTLIQSMNEEIDDNPQLVKVESNGEIVLLDEKKMIFKVEYVTMYFDRK